MVQKTDYRSGHNAHGNSEQTLASSECSPLKALRKERGLYAKELARQLGYSQGYIGRLENGIVRPSAELADRLALLFDSSKEELFPGGVGRSKLGCGPLTEDQTTVLGARLSRLRCSKRYSRNELAMRAGLSLQTIQNVENGKNRLIHPRTAHLLGNVLGVGVEYFEPYVGSPASAPDILSGSRGRSPYVKKIIGIRVEAGYQVPELAKEAGVGRATIFQAEAGATAYSRKTANKLAPVLGVEAPELLDDKHGSMLDEELVDAQQAARKMPFAGRSFAEKLLTLRVERSMTRCELAVAASTTIALIKRVEHAVLTGDESGGVHSMGKGRASRAMLVRKLASALGVEPLELSDEATLAPLADKLLDLRAGWGVSVRELGRHTGIHPQQLLSYENTWKTSITAEHARALGEFYGVKPDQLYALGQPGEPVPAHERQPATHPSARTVEAFTGSNRETQRMKGVFDHCLLALIQQRPQYGFEIINELDESGLLTVGEGSIYPILSRMNDDGLVSVEDVRSADTGRRRRYYSITATGEEQLREWNRQWVSFGSKVGRILGVNS